MNKQALEALIKEANELHRKMAADGERLGELKDKLRAEAEKQGLGAATTKVTLEGGKFGNVEVVYVGDKCVFKKGANPLGLKPELDRATFQHLFVEEIELSSEFEDALKLLPAPERAKVKALVEWKPMQARVALDK